MDTALGPYRVLDLTSERGWLCGKLLADLGADVIKVEPPGGDPGRSRGPAFGDQSVRWWFFNRGKRSVIADLDTPAGRDRVLDLVRGADVVVESSPVGSMPARGLGPGDLLAVNPQLVVTSISPFGQDGPYATYRGPDLVVAALGGPLWLTGDPDRPPVRISVPQYDLVAAAEAAANTTIALYHAARTGCGQHVDVAAQLCAIRTLMNATAYPYLEGRNLSRQGGNRASSDVRFRLVNRCADGHVAMLLGVGARGAPSAQALMGWMAERGALAEWLAALDWAATDWGGIARAGDPDDLFGRISDAVQAFFETLTKEEIYAGALAHRLLIAPVNTVADIRADEQLAARGYFVPVDHGDREPVVYAGPWARLSATPLADTPRAPYPGEHDEAVAAAPGPRPAPHDGLPEPPDVFTGLKVWDMSWVGVGPMTARYLADYGATVVRLDSSARPDILRLSPPFKDGTPGLNRSQFYADFNASKLGIGIDLDKPAGRQVAQRLVAWADVVLESFTPKTMAAWGMSYTELRALNPGLIMLSTCMQGQTGPRAHYRGFGQLMASLAGFYEITGWPDRGPTPVFGAYTDFVCQRFATTALVAALDHRRRTGAGQHIDLAQYEAALQFLGPELLDYELNGVVATRRGNTDPDCCPHGVYPCAGEERWIAIAVEDDEQWRALRARMGDPAWAADAALDTLAGRKAREHEIDAHVRAWTRQRRAEEIFHLLQPEVAAGVVHEQSGLHADPQVVHRGYFETLDHTEMGPVPYDGLQARLSRTPGRLRKAAPRLGEDTVYVLAEILGMDGDEIADLFAAEAVEVS